MDKIEFRRYDPATDSGVWDEFVMGSRCGTFQQMRPYMDYHADRFSDYSVLAYKDGKLLALLPANVTEAGVLHSHSGLTYGGWVTPMRHFSGVSMLNLMTSFREWGRSEGFSSLDYKPVPYIYHLMPASEDEYALWRLGARITAEGLSTAIDLSLPLDFNQLQRRMCRRAEIEGCSVRALSIDEIPIFWNLLAECLRTRHDVTPVHTAAELELLASRFPDNIRFAGAFTADGLLGAAICLYLTERVVHSQYIATNEPGRKSGMLPLLVRDIAKKAQGKYRYFDFGISTEDGGKVLNEGLNMQKSSFGGGGVVYRRYELDF